MNFGLFYYCQGRGVPHDQAYAEMLDQIVLAERLGFDECWFAEHHFTDYSLLSFHHPLRLAAEAAMLDNLARGRFDFGVGKGVRPGEFAQLGLRFEDGVAMTEEAIEGVVQRPHPPLHEVASRPASVARVGARGWPVALHFTPTEVVARCVQDYRDALATRREPVGTGPYRPRLVLCRETYVAERAEVARAEGALALQGFWHLSSLAPPPPPAEFSDVLLKDLTARVWGGQTYDELDAIGGFLIGAPDQVTARVKQLESIGVDTLLLVCSFVTLSHEQVCRSLELFAGAVIRP
jgi:alkanesulfonate monooxygenase SsuD/methylene tetrahydromethanopterin reductase-like flavin-dependent oxidoreductase (luciferase family)